MEWHRGPLVTVSLSLSLSLCFSLMVNILNKPLVTIIREKSLIMLLLSF